MNVEQTSVKVADNKDNIDRPIKRRRKRRADSKYNEKFTKQLRSGIRFKEGGLSVVELCQKWRISRDTFYDWVDTIPEFAEAYRLSKADCAAWWHKQYRGIVTGEIKGHGGAAIFAMTNIEGIGWASKVDVNTTEKQTIGAININILESPKRSLEQQSGNIIEAEVEDIKQISNVVKLHDD